MPNITHENLDALNAVVTIELSQNDYLPKVNKKLKEYRQKAQIKGFRPGKVPMGMIKRKFGNALLVEEVNEIVGKNMNNYFDENKIKVLGQPLAIEDSKVVISINKPSDYTFKFELGLAPEFELKGLSTESMLPFYDIEVLEEELEKEIDNVRRKFSNGFMEGVTDIQEEDMLSISLHELDDKSGIKEEGVVKEETFLALKDVVNTELRDNLLTATVDDSFDINIFNIEDKTEEHIRKHVLGIEEGKEINETFRLTIKEIKRVEKAELNEDFFNKVFPEQGISTLDAFNAKVKEEIYNSYKQSALNHYTNLAFDFLLEENQLDFPEEFLTKWLKSSQDDLSTDFFEGEEFQNFLKNLRWSLIREKIAEQFKVEVQYKDVEEMTRNEILRYFNYQIPAFGEMMDGMLEKILSDKKEVNRRFEMLMDQKVLENAAENMGKEMIAVNKEEFEKIVKEYQDLKNPSVAEGVIKEENEKVAEEVEITEE
jgi:trigger factor